MARSYSVPKGNIETTYEVKKSRFITRLFSVNNREQAMEALAQARTDYPDARHHCWAYQIGPPTSPSLAAMSDDGEPSGTAGKPILNVIQHKDIGDAMVIVIRYFGGIKLGAGGLVRAYSQAAQQAYDEGKTELRVELDEFKLQCDFAEEQAIRHWLAQHKGEIINTDYQQAVLMTIAIDDSQLQELSAFLASLKGAELLKT
jgi:uncharacterized YigZ family protein